MLKHRVWLEVLLDHFNVFSCQNDYIQETSQPKDGSVTLCLIVFSACLLLHEQFYLKHSHATMEEDEMDKPGQDPLRFDAVMQATKVTV